MRSLLLLAAVSAAFAVPLNGPKKYTNHRLLSAEGISVESFRTAEQLGNEGLLDLWSHRSEGKGSILFSVAPEHLAKVEGEFSKLGLKLTVKKTDIQELIDRDQADSSHAVYVSDRPINFDQFESYEQIVSSLNYYSKNGGVLPTVQPFTIGKSVESRDIFGIRISNSTAKKPVIFMECGIHAREWAATSTCLYIIDQLITNSNSYKDLLDRYEFQIIPSANPDGYTYTRTGDRLWRKNRSKQDKGCFGVDLNRNWKAGPHCGVGTSTDPCSEIFCGSAPFSEPESAALRNYISQLNGRIEYYVSLHTFGLMWMFPYSYTSKPCADNDDLLRRAKIGVDAILNHTGSKYTFGPIASTIYEVTGSSVDWTYIYQNIRKSFALELQPASDDPSGFVLDKKLIRFVGDETFTGLKAMWLS